MTVEITLTNFLVEHHVTLKVAIVMMVVVMMNIMMVMIDGDNDDVGDKIDGYDDE